VKKHEKIIKALEDELDYIRDIRDSLVESDNLADWEAYVFQAECALVVAREAVND
jgi:hypothetical protein